MDNKFRQSFSFPVMLDRPNGPRVLVVEDDDLIGQVIRNLLTRFGYDVQNVPDGITALEMVTAYQPDIIVLDMYLPFLNGWEFLLRYQAENPTARIVAMSARAVDMTTLTGVHAFVPKPFRSQEFLDVIAAQSSGANYRQ